MWKTAAAVAGAFLICGSSLYAQNRTSDSFRSTREAVQYYEELVGTLSRQVKQMQDDNASMNEALRSLKQRVTALEETSRQSTSQVDQLRKKIAADSEARNAQLNNLAEKLSKPQAVPAAAPKTAAVQKKKTPAAQESAAGAGTEEVECLEHVVESGQTLSAIARAYHVSVREIRSFNNLKSDNLRVGQKLLIPDKKH